jgi:hypothetical protein
VGGGRIYEEHNANADIICDAVLELAPAAAKALKSAVDMPMLTKGKRVHNDIEGKSSGKEFQCEGGGSNIDTELLDVLRCCWCHYDYARVSVIQLVIE